MISPMQAAPVRLSELVATLSLVSDLGMGRPVERELSISRKTVSSHLEHIYAKLGISTRTEAALFAMRHGFTDRWPSDKKIR